MCQSASLKLSYFISFTLNQAQTLVYIYNMDQQLADQELGQCSDKEIVHMSL